MSFQSRRRFLRSSGVTAALLAGCITSPGNSAENQPTERDTTTETSMEEQISASALSATASVVDQATDDHPLTVELGLTNDHDRTVQIVPSNRGRLLEHIPELEGKETSLVVVPVQDVSSVTILKDVSQSRKDGCWRFVTPEGEPAVKTIIDTAVSAPLEPRETYSIRHYIYHKGESEGCFPDQRYSTTVSFEFDGTEGTAVSFDLRYVLNVEDAQDASIRVDGPQRS